MKKYYPKPRKLSLSQIPFYSVDLINNGQDNAPLSPPHLAPVHPMKESTIFDDGSKPNF